jgi:hypothetical protein
MKSKPLFLLSVLTVALSVMGSECVNSPFIVSVNLDKIAECYDINPGDGTWNDQSDPIIIQDLIDENFKDDITGYRLYDIRVRVTATYPDGFVSGNVSYSFDFGPVNTVITSFQGQTADFKGNGVSLLNPGSLITYNQAELQAFVNALNDPNFTPQQVVLYSAGDGPEPVPAGEQVCIEIYVQADAEVN